MVVGTVDIDISALVTLTLTITPHLAYYYPYDMTKKTCLVIPTPLQIYKNILVRWQMRKDEGRRLNPAELGEWLGTQFQTGCLEFD